MIILCLLFAALFIFAFVSKRRYGMLALALAAGSMLSTLWVGDLTPIIAQAGFVLVRPPLESVVAATLTLLPAIMLLTSGLTYHKPSQRLGSAALFALFAVILLLGPFESAVNIDGIGKEVYDFLVSHRIMIITGCLLIAVFDTMLAKPPKIPSKH